MRIVREPLGKRIEAYNKQGDGRQVEADGVDVIRDVEECRTAGDQQEFGAEQRNGTCREMAVSCSWVQLVEVTVHNSIEGHRAGSSGDHGAENEKEKTPTGPASIFPCSQQHRCQRKGQGEDRVGNFYKSSPFRYFLKNPFHLLHLPVPDLFMGHSASSNALYPPARECIFL